MRYAGQSLQFHGQFVIVISGIVEVPKKAQACRKTDSVAWMEVWDIPIHGHGNVFTEGYVFFRKMQTLGPKREPFDSVFDDLDRIEDHSIDDRLFVLTR